MINQQLSNNIFTSWIADEPEEEYTEPEDKIIIPEEISAQKIFVSKINIQIEHEQSPISNESSNQSGDTTMQPVHSGSAKCLKLKKSINAPKMPEHKENIPTKFGDYILFMALAVEESEPITWQEVLNSKYINDWLTAMRLAEITSFNIS